MTEATERRAAMTADVEEGTVPKTPTRIVLRVTSTETMFVSVGAEDADWLAPEKGSPDMLDVSEAVTRWKRAVAYRQSAMDHDLTIDREEPDGWWKPEVIDGDAKPAYLWSSREFVGRARYELSVGRYREGNCPELDALNGELARLEDRLRLMAMEVENPEDPEVVSWRAK